MKNQFSGICSLSILLLVFILTKQCYSQNQDHGIIGRWLPEQNDNSYTEFTSDGKYILTVDGIKLMEMGYSVENTNDSTYIYLTDQNSKDLPIKILAKIENEYLILIYYKSANLEISSHIDELSVYRREGSPPFNYKISQNDIITKYFFEYDFTGKAFVAYDQSSGYPIEFDEQGNRIIRISKSGLCKTKFHEDPISFAKKKYKFYYQQGNICKEIRGISAKKIVELINRKDSVDYFQNYNADSIYVFIWGYNPGRGYLNSDLGEKIDGNVEMFEVDTLKNLLK